MGVSRRREKIPGLFAAFVFAAAIATGCAHYPVNQPLKQIDPQGGYRGKYMGTPGNSENLLLYLTFSGGGTRAAAFVLRGP
jgi:NTE family protein